MNKSNIIKTLVVSVSIVGLLSFVVSYNSIYEIGITYGFKGYSSKILPCLIDLSVLILGLSWAVAVIFKMNSKDVKTIKAYFITLTCLSVLANGVHGLDVKLDLLSKATGLIGGIVAFIIHAIPAVVLGLCVEVLIKNLLHFNSSDTPQEIPQEVRAFLQRGANNAISQAMIYDLKKRFENGETTSSIAKETKIHHTTVTKQRNLFEEGKLNEIEPPKSYDSEVHGLSLKAA